MANIMLRKETVKTVEKYTSVENANMLESKVHSLGRSTVTVTNTGVVSSGKSSLFNALLENNRFSVGAARTTLSKDVEKYTDNIELVDTPGIDVKEEDDVTALNAVCSSSIIVMVHNIKMGMLQKNEVDWLKKIAFNFHNTEEMKDRFIFVSSWIDERMAEDSYQNTIDETKKILFETMRAEVECFNVSSKLYQKGVSENKERLIDLSNVPMLKAAILHKANLYSKKYGENAAKMEAIRLCDEDSKILSDVNNKKNKEKLEIETNIKSKYDVKLNKWKSVYTRYNTMLKQLNDINNELNNYSGGMFKW